MDNNGLKWTETDMTGSQAEIIIDLDHLGVGLDRFHSCIGFSDFTVPVLFGLLSQKI